MIRMANLAIVGSHCVNGVAQMHTSLLRKRIFPEFDILYPGRFCNKTNGITPRRFLRACNRPLASLIDEVIGENWTTDLEQLIQLEPYALDTSFQQRFKEIKQKNKSVLANIIKKELGISVSVDALFDVQVKRIHEYKRQHLNLLHILNLYYRILENPDEDIPPRVCIFSGKAAPDYFMAKEIIYAINQVANCINKDKSIGDRLTIVFLPNYRLSLAGKIIPAADLSEHISTVGKEASGTGNMKFALNGSLIIGTKDGANVEIQEAIGKENMFIFGPNIGQVEILLEKGYNPKNFYESDPSLKRIIDDLIFGKFTIEDSNALHPLCHSLLDEGDPFLVCSDYAAYIECQNRVNQSFLNQDGWIIKAILSTARMGYFSSDRVVRQYADEIWNLQPLDRDLGV